MGNPNLMREEARLMRNRSERSLVLFAVIFVFVCLLLSGGSRLIGHEDEVIPVQMADVSGVPSAFSAAPAPLCEMGLEPICKSETIRDARADTPDCSLPCARVICDANGNVISGTSYLRAVYQAFSLGDGFV